MTAPRHAAPSSAPLLYPAHYLTPDTREYPLVLLVEGQGDGYAGVGDSPLPVAHGVRLHPQGLDLPPGVGAEPCEGCGGYGVDCTVEGTLSGGGNPAYDGGWHLSCILDGDHLGMVPTCYIEFVPTD